MAELEIASIPLELNLDKLTCVSNEIVQDNHLFKLLLELLLQRRRPLETRAHTTLNGSRDASMETTSLILTMHTGGRSSPRSIVPPFAIRILRHRLWPWMVPHKDISVLESVQKQLEAPYFVWQRFGAMLCLGSTSIQIVVVERRGRQPYNLGARDNIEFESSVDQRCRRLGDITEVRDQTGKREKERKKTWLENIWSCTMTSFLAMSGKTFLKFVFFSCSYQLRPKQHGKRLRWIHLAHLGLSCP